jgi:flavin reductase (DIM6/NTAB) family NADH-FMN oxidoreductase RutF
MAGDLRRQSAVAQPGEAAITGLALRQALGLFASGVTVVTTGSGPDDVHGRTANAFTSVSLDPPLVLVSIATTARMDTEIRANGRYGISILGHEMEPHSLHFAGARRVEDIRFVERDGVPLLEGAIAHLACTVEASHPAGDHTLHIGRVDALWKGYGEPLVFFTGAFRTLEPEYDASALQF